MVNWLHLYGGNAGRRYCSLLLLGRAPLQLRLKMFPGCKVGLVMERDFWLGFC